MPRRRVSCITFNQDGSRLAVGYEGDDDTGSGFAVYTLEPVSLETSMSTATSKTSTPTSLALLFRTRVNALVLASQPNVVALHDGSSSSSSSASTLLGELSFPASAKVLAVRLRRDAVAVALSDGRAAAYSLDSLRLLRSVETGPNELGLLALAAGGSRTVFACPSVVVDGEEEEEEEEAKRGGRRSSRPSLGGLLRSLREKAGIRRRREGAARVEFVDAGRSVLIRAARHPLAALALSQSAELLATASERGTLVRIFGVGEESRVPSSAASSSLFSPSAASVASSEAALTPCLRELRRGGDPARMLSLAFSPSVSVAIAAASSSSLATAAAEGGKRQQQQQQQQEQRPQWLAAASDKGTVHVWSLFSRSSSPPPAAAAAAAAAASAPQRLLAAVAAAAGAPSPPPPSLAAERSSFHFKLPAVSPSPSPSGGSSSSSSVLAALSFSPGGQAVFAASATSGGGGGEAGRCGLVAVALPRHSEGEEDGGDEGRELSRSSSFAAELFCVPDLLESLRR